jgi:hypothetical protein
LAPCSLEHGVVQVTVSCLLAARGLRLDVATTSAAVSSAAVSSAAGESEGGDVVAASAVTTPGALGRVRFYRGGVEGVGR